MAIRTKPHIRPVPTVILTGRGMSTGGSSDITEDEDGSGDSQTPTPDPSPVTLVRFGNTAVRFGNTAVTFGEETANE